MNGFICEPIRPLVFFIHFLSYSSRLVFCIGLVVGLWLYTLVVGVCFVMLPTSYVSELESEGPGERKLAREL